MCEQSPAIIRVLLCLPCVERRYRFMTRTGKSSRSLVEMSQERHRIRYARFSGKNFSPSASRALLPLRSASDNELNSARVCDWPRGDASPCRFYLQRGANLQTTTDTPFSVASLLQARPQCVFPASLNYKKIKTYFRL